MSRRKRKKPAPKKKRGDPIALYECLGCGRKWGENLAELSRMRANGRLPDTYSGAHCPCNHPYIKWTNYDELAPRLKTNTGRIDGEP